VIQNDIYRLGSFCSVSQKDETIDLGYGFVYRVICVRKQLIFIEFMENFDVSIGVDFL